MKNGILVSVIMPVFNVRPYLVEAINSVAQQGYKNLEIIIIDDGSTDGSEDVCDEYARKDQRIRVIHQGNRGLSAARNVGLDAMTGEVVAFLDSDDAYRPTFIESMLLAMVQNESDLVICKYQRCQTTETLVYNSSIKATPSICPGNFDRVQALHALAEGAINPMVWNKLYKRELWEGIRFSEEHVHEDIDVIFRIFDQCKQASVVDEPLYLHRIHSRSITSNATKRNAEDCFLALSHFESFVRSNIPEVFTEEHLIRVRQYQLDWMIRYYIQLLQKNKKEDAEYCENLRESIVSLKNTVGMVNNELLKTVRYWLIHHFPYFLRVVYPLYRRTKRV